MADLETGELDKRENRDMKKFNIKGDWAVRVTICPVTFRETVAEIIDGSWQVSM